MSDSDADDDTLQPIHNNVTLCNAAIRGDLAALRRELDAGVSPNCVGFSADGEPATPLLILCSSDTTDRLGFVGSDDIRLQAVQMLLAAGASPDHIEGLHNDPPLVIAASYALPAVVKALLAAGADPTWADANGWTALHSVTCYGSSTSRNASCAVALLRAGADVNALYNERADGYFWTPLTWCLQGDCGHGTRHSCVLPVLLRAGATLDMASIEWYEEDGYHYLEKVDAAGGWKRYAQAHTARLAPIFAKIFPHARLPPELVAHIVDLWAHVGYY